MCISSLKVLYCAVLYGNQVVPFPLQLEKTRLISSVDFEGKSQKASIIDLIGL